jgi:hypothetical protein
VRATGNKGKSNKAAALGFAIAAFLLAALPQSAPGEARRAALPKVERARRV